MTKTRFNGSNSLRDSNMIIKKTGRVRIKEIFLVKKILNKKKKKDPIIIFIVIMTTKFDGVDKNAKKIIRQRIINRNISFFSNLSVASFTGFYYNKEIMTKVKQSKKTKKAAKTSKTLKSVKVIKEVKVTSIEDEKQKIIEKYSQKKGDTGSPEVQAALLSYKIENLSEHLEINKKDNHSRRGLLKIIAKRRRILNYLEKLDEKRYKKLIKELGLKK